MIGHTGYNSNEMTNDDDEEGNACPANTETCKPVWSFSFLIHIHCDDWPRWL
jgi:hypothetical protein